MVWVFLCFYVCIFMCFLKEIILFYFNFVYGNFFFIFLFELVVGKGIIEFCLFFYID